MKKLILLILTATTVGLPQLCSAGEVESILAEADRWIISDTARIMSYIDSCNEVTEKRLKSSPYWDDAYRDLSFLLGIDYVSMPQIDNTGRIYFVMRLTGEIEHLFYVDKPLTWPIQLTPNSWTNEGYTIYYYNVHPSGDYVLVGAMKYGSEKHDIFMFNRDGSFKPLLVDPEIEYGNVIFKNKDQFFLVAADDTSRTLCRYTISSGKLEPLYNEGEWVDIYDYHDGQLLCERWFSFSESQVFLIDENSIQTRNLTDKGYFEYSKFTGDGRVITVTSTLSKKDEFNKLALIDIAKPKKFTALYDPGMEIDGLKYIKPAKQCLVMLNNEGFSELKAVGLDGALTTIPWTSTGVMTDLGANDSTQFVFAFSSPNTAPTLYLSRLGSKSFTQVATVATFGFDFSGVQVQVIHYPSKDGTMVPALLYLPPGIKQDGSNPAIVDYHGGPPGQSRPYFQRNIAFAITRGFIMMLPNVRGSTGYGTAWEMADNLQGRYRALEDCVGALDFLVEAGYSSPDKIGIWGASYGGYTVNYLAVTVPDKFACVVSEVGEADMDYDNTHGDVTFLQGWEREYGPIGSKLTHDLSPIFKAENVKRPMLITAGFNDPRVFPGDPRRWSYLLSRLGKDVLYYEEVKTGHWGTSKQQVIDAYAMAYVYFMEHLMK